MQIAKAILRSDDVSSPLFTSYRPVLLRSGSDIDVGDSQRGFRWGPGDHHFAGYHCPVQLVFHGQIKQGTLDANDTRGREPIQDTIVIVRILLYLVHRYSSMNNDS